MKRFLVILAMTACASLAAEAQNYRVDMSNPEMLRFGHHHEPSRKEIVMPSKVNGYNVYKADLHTHTIYSDGKVTPYLRIKEAWIEGLDVIAITDHIEYRPYDETFADYIASKRRKDPDLNTSVEQARSAAEEWDVFLIPGTEITRHGGKIGHFNALFTKDNNKIYDDDPVQSMRNAKKQGALVMHNHPGWIRTSIDFTEVEAAAYAEGLIDGVEVMNYNEFYPGIIDRVQERGLFISANTDVHEISAIDFNSKGFMRPMTLILAADRTEKGLREALEAGRTLAYGYETLCGAADLLNAFFKASVSVKKLSRKVHMLTNNTSVPFVIQQEGRNPVHLDPFSTIRIEGELKFMVLNMFSGKDTHPEVDLSF